ncbi:MAG: hypothetical protein ABIG60_00745 [Patescibacteria group bacterium]
MVEIKKVNKITVANIFAAFYGLSGFFVSLAVAVSALFNIILHKDFSGSVIIIALFNIGVGVLIGIFAALLACFLGWIIGYMVASFYNFFARIFGGIKVELFEQQKENFNKEN